MKQKLLIIFQKWFLLMQQEWHCYQINLDKLENLDLTDLFAWRIPMLCIRTFLNARWKMKLKSLFLGQSHVIWTPFLQAC